MKASLRLGGIASIEIGIHYTRLFAFVLIAWSLAEGFFPRYSLGWAGATYWGTGIFAALLFFVLVLVLQRERLVGLLSRAHVIRYKQLSQELGLRPGAPR